MVKMRKDEKANTLVKTYERGFPVGFKASLEASRAWGEAKAPCLHGVLLRVCVGNTGLRA